MHDCRCKIYKNRQNITILVILQPRLKCIKQNNDFVDAKWANLSRSVESKYVGHPISSETLFIICLCIKFAYQKCKFRMAYLVAHSTKYSKYLFNRWLFVA